MNPLILALAAPVGVALLAVMNPALTEPSSAQSPIEAPAPAVADTPRARQVITASQDNMPTIVPGMAGLSTPVIRPPITSDMPTITPSAQPKIRRREVPKAPASE